ncbi:UDP-N-acetylglucosamine 1-carboxyvinyltransferase [Candidatus Desantisbacteria bacterium CG1_02_38_46]|uniref:UDP-N-acetylglucosamine 1-carboxyvinyltransferase n=2 Tax=unclassified Candidatus Desantisiibacteriota TaxID=3106372 RepID=A0A1J4SFJ8_9BACT|nr:MAG: UDP-N-acetylglucosamine 1-carboxyvinyltransferase [Candidatus Desantisbacteria bacterium CG1_02_38_46]PIU51791.1 MAG: UDP-N-acetylglucosamine 1-carboxyvinyltransferase [Candidatus Desantisbacteria bacterium CG07_land_8_20_14_0_80_39_15]
MARFIMSGGEELKGEISISGAKNAALPIMAATLLSEGDCIIENVPGLKDVRTMSFILRTIGARVEEGKNTLRIIPPQSLHYEVPYELVKTMRASVLVLGPLISRLKKARVSLPGGCAIGVRPINLHLKGLMKLGASIRIKEGYVEAQTSGLKGARIYLDTQSVGATENLIMAATLASGTTYIENAAKEPEIVDLANFLNRMGAKIKNAGSDIIEITGVPNLKGANYTVIPDRIEAGTFMIGCAITGGEVTLRNVRPDHLEAIITKLQEMGVEILSSGEVIHVKGNKELQAVEVKTMPHPGFPTDLQPQIMSLASVCKGTSVITEDIFENRFIHAGELQRMGADIEIKGNTAFVRGVPGLNGASVMASDIRAGAALVIAGLIARPETRISRIYHIDRGYEEIEKKLQILGAKIKRIQ